MHVQCTTLKALHAPCLALAYNNQFHNSTSCIGKIKIQIQIQCMPLAWPQNRTQWRKLTKIHLQSHYHRWCKECSRIFLKLVHFVFFPVERPGRCSPRPAGCITSTYQPPIGPGYSLTNPSYCCSCFIILWSSHNGVRVKYNSWIIPSHLKHINVNLNLLHRMYNLIWHLCKRCWFI